MKRNIFGELSLTVSKKTSKTFEDFGSMFSNLNVQGIDGVQLRLMDGSIHTVKVEDFFIEWENDE